MEPERPIEKLLREWAKQRAGDTRASRDLHPATRRLLQGEVARKFGQPQIQAGGLSGWLAVFWPRIAWSLGVFAVLAIAAWMVFPPLRGTTNSARLAKSESRLSLDKELSPAPMNEPTAVESDSLKPVPQISRTEASEPPLPSRSFGQAPPPTSAESGSLKSNGKLQDRNGRVARSDFAGLDKDLRDLKSPSSPPVVMDELRGGQSPPVVQPGYAAGPGPLTRSESTKREHASGLASAPPSPASAAAPLQAHGGSGGTSPLESKAIAGYTALSPGQSGNMKQNAAVAGAHADGSATVTASSPAATTTGRGAELAIGDSGARRQWQSNADSFKSMPRPTGSPQTSDPSAKAEYRFANTVKKELPREIQRFARLGLETKLEAASGNRASAAADVLADFELEHVGHEIRIVDKDGSVYIGYVEPALETLRSPVPRVTGTSAGPAKPNLALNGNKIATAEANRETQTGQSYSFRVTGTNKTQNLPVVFTGSVAADNQQIFSYAITNSVRLRAGNEKSNANGPTNAARLQISGKARIGARKEVEIQAVGR